MKLTVAWLAAMVLTGALSLLPADAGERDFREYCAGLAGETKGPVIVGRDGWLFLKSEIRFLGAGKFWGEDAAKVSKASKPEWSDPLPAIVDFHRQLATLGIRLLVVPVPPKAEVYSDLLPDPSPTAEETARPCAALGEFLRLLSDDGVEVLDLYPVFRAERERTPESLLYCRTDSHWSPWGAWIAAQAVVAALDGRPTLSPVGADRLGKPAELGISGDLYLLSKGEEKKSSEKLPLWRVPGNKGVSPGSPLLLLGDSHGLVFQAGGDMFAADGGFPAFISALRDEPVDLIAVRGSAATPVRLNLAKAAAKNPEYLSGKKIVVWFFAARELTEAQGWRIVRLPAAGD